MTVLGSTCPYYGGHQVPNPANVILPPSAPSSNLKVNLGTLAVVNSTGTMYGAVSKVGGVTTWTVLGGSTGAVSTETGDTGTATPVAGNIKHAGTANQITTAASGAQITYSIPSAFIAPGSISAAAGDIVASAGNLQSIGAGKGLIVPTTTVSGASPQTANSRSFSVTFTGVSIAAGATQSFTIANTLITSTSVIVMGMIGGTTGAALTIQSVSPTTNSVAIVVTNGTGATTTTAAITFNGLVVN